MNQPKGETIVGAKLVLGFGTVMVVMYAVVAVLAAVDRHQRPQLEKLRPPAEAIGH